MFASCPRAAFVAVVVGFSASAALAETHWTVTGGRTDVFFHTDALPRLGLIVEPAAVLPETLSPAHLPLSIADSSDLSLVAHGGILERFDAGRILHRSGFVLHGADARVDVSTLAIRPTTAGAGPRFRAENDAVPRYAGGGLDLGTLKIAFDARAQLLLVEGAEVAITVQLAEQLRRPELAGEIIASIQIIAELAWSGGDAPAAASVFAKTKSGTAERGGTPCDRNGPDVIVGELIDIGNFNSVGGIEAFAVGTTSCNVGDVNLSWIANTNEHPVIAQNMYRLKNNRFEHVGMSWLKHGFNALTLNACGCGCNGQGGSTLGVGCSDPYESFLNGDQNRLGPRFQVNPYTGVFDFPYFAMGQTGDSIYKRLQVKISDLDPALDGGGQYFVEGQYVTQDDAAAGNQANNASYRPITVSGSGSAWSVALTGTTVREQPAIRAWQAADPAVDEAEVQVPNDGLVLVAAKATALGGGVWHYEYAVQNLYSDRAVGSFRVPVGIGASVTNIGFHDVDYHSGEPFDGTDWPGAFDGQYVRWSTDDHDINSNANALRWGTLYNFRFDANRPPDASTVTLGLFKPGAPSSMNATITGPTVGVLCATGFGDGNGDCRADLRDYALLQQCFAGSGNPYDPACACFDAGTDEDIDLDDFALIADVWTGPIDLLTGCTVR